MTKSKLHEHPQTAHEFAHEDREATLERQPIRHRGEWELYRAVEVVAPESFNQRLAKEAIKNYDNAPAKAEHFVDVTPVNDAIRANEAREQAAIARANGEGNA